MANNKNNKKKKQQRPGYFQQNVQQFGEDFLERKTAKDIERDSQRVFKDIAFQSPEAMDNIVQYFENRTFLANLVTSANETLMERYAIYLGLSTYLQMIQQNPQQAANGFNIEKYLIKAKNNYDAYCIIVQYLNNIVSVINTGYDQSWVYVNILNNLRSMSAALGPHKYHI